MSDSKNAQEFRATVAENFVISDPQFASQLKVASTATEFHALLKNKFNHCDPEKDLALRVRLLRHMSCNKSFVFQEQEQES